MNRDDIIRMAREADVWMTSEERVSAVLRFAEMLQAPSRQPLSDEALRQIIEAEHKRTGWKIPPTIQVARAVERAHGIGGDND